MLRFKKIVDHLNTSLFIDELKISDCATVSNQGIDIRPFQGWHPPSKLMVEVASPPYDVINTKDARKLAKEKSFLHVNKPEIEFDDNTDPYSDQVYEMGKQQLLRFCENGWLIKDKHSCFYIYAQQMGDHKQFGLVCESSAIQYEQNIIKKHELTHKKKEDDRTKLTDVQSANVGPIFMCYKAVKEIDQKISDWVCTHSCYSEFVSEDGIIHTLWILDDAEFNHQIRELFTNLVPCSYVADGHHRTASAWRVYKQRRERLENNNCYTGKEPFHYFLSVLFPDNQVKILDYNRVVHDLNAHCSSVSMFLQKLTDNHWTYHKLSYDECLSNESLRCKNANDFRMYIANHGWYCLRLDENIIKSVSDDVVRKLDSHLLSTYLFNAVLGIKDAKGESISYIGGIHGLKYLERQTGNSGVAFALYPTTFKQVMDVSDAGRLMPAKSTWFEPKLRSGVVVRRF